MKNIIILLITILISVNAHAVFIEIITDSVEQTKVFINPDKIISIEIKKDGDYIVTIVVEGNTYGRSYNTKAEAQAFLQTIKQAVGVEKF